MMGNNELTIRSTRLYFNDVGPILLLAIIIVVF